MLCTELDFCTQKKDTQKQRQRYELFRQENTKQCISLRNVKKPFEQKRMILDCNLDMQKVRVIENSS